MIELCIKTVILFVSCIVLLIAVRPRSQTYKQEFNEYKQSVYFKTTKNNYNKVASDAGLLGEYQISQLLEPYCSSGAKMLYNLYIPYKSGYTEIDVVMIHPAGIFVIESKNYSGVVYGNANDKMWMQKINGQIQEFYNPVAQNALHVGALRKLLGNNVNMHPFVVFSNRCKLKIRTQNNCLPVIHQKQLRKDIKRIINYGYTSMTSTQINKTYRLLKQYVHVNEKIKKQHQEAVAAATRRQR
jgi:hypothetical protein